MTTWTVRIHLIEVSTVVCATCPEKDTLALVAQHEESGLPETLVIRGPGSFATIPRGRVEWVEFIKDPESIKVIKDPE